MEVGDVRVLEVHEPTHAGQARRASLDLVRELGWSEHDRARLGIVITEAATNLVKHARDGRMLLQTLEDGRGRGFSALALDQGPGMSHLPTTLQDGFSSTGTPGTGLGAIIRQSDEFDIFSEPERGTGVFMTLWPEESDKPEHVRTIGGVSVPMPGEIDCGDAWATVDRQGKRFILVTDGLGHGPLAREASDAARRFFLEYAGGELTELMARLNDRLRPTRGAAVAIAELDAPKAVLRYCGVGNIAGQIIHQGSVRSLVSMHGTVGHDARKIQEFSYPWPEGATLVLSSDGLGRHWDLTQMPALASRAPTLVAGILYRDHARGRDDTTVVVARNAA